VTGVEYKLQIQSMDPTSGELLRLDLAHASIYEAGTPGSVTLTT
jgi:hypothetical protein